jgi:hypothetical protein
MNMNFCLWHMAFELLSIRDLKILDMLSVQIFGYQGKTTKYYLNFIKIISYLRYYFFIYLFFLSIMDFRFRDNHGISDTTGTKFLATLPISRNSEYGSLTYL